MSENNIRALVVDEQLDSRKILRSALLGVNADIDIEFASNGRDALEMCENFKPNIIITDVFLSYADGLYILEQTKDLDCIKIVTIFMHKEHIIRKAFEFGADYIFVKPLTENVVRDRIISILQEKEKKNDMTQEKPSLSKSLSLLLTRIGVPANIQGFKFLKYAIMLAIQNHDYVKNITGMLYPAIAEKFSSTPSRVERNIRTSIEVAYNRGNTELQNEIFGYTIDENKGKPTNSEFIAMIADRLITEYTNID